MKRTIARFISDESGASAIEYSVIGTTIAMLLVVSLTTIGGKLTGWFQSSADGMS